MIGKNELFEQWWKHWISRTRQSRFLVIKAPSSEKRGIDPMGPDGPSADTVFTESFGPNKAPVASRPMNISQDAPLSIDPAPFAVKNRPLD